MVGWLLSLAIRTFVPGLPSTVPLWSVVAGFTVATGVGLFFGLWPALKASAIGSTVPVRRLTLRVSIWYCHHQRKSC